MGESNTRQSDSDRKEKRRELLLFLFITLIVFPILSVCVVGGYGLAVWIYQMIAGPPGPPAG